MDLQSLRMLMDINALQSFGSVQNFSANAETSTSPFSTMLGDILSQAGAGSTDPNTLNPLLYNGLNEIFLPASLATLQIPTINQGKTAPVQGHTTSGKQHTNNYTQFIKKAAEQFNLPERLISAVIKHESNFNSQTVSRAGAQGLMQLMPGTAKFLGVKNSFDPEQNITGGARYLRQMLDQFNGDTSLALAAYNAGPGNVRKYDGIPPFKETQNYVNKVLNSFHNA